eukprot:219599_1
MKINKWQSENSKSTKVKTVSTMKQSKIEEFKNAMVIDNVVDWMDEGTDAQIVKDFCAITHATKEIAIQILQQTDWDIVFAMNKYYGSNNIKFDGENDEIHQDQKCSDSKEVVYNHGIAFWYWNTAKANTQRVRKKYKNLQEEVLNFSCFTIKEWKYLVDECNILIETDKL